MLRFKPTHVIDKFGNIAARHSDTAAVIPVNAIYICFGALSAFREVCITTTSAVSAALACRQALDYSVQVEGWQIATARGGSHCGGVGMCCLQKPNVSNVAISGAAAKVMRDGLGRDKLGLM